MHQTLQLVDRFISVIADQESQSASRLKSEWRYFYEMVRNQPIAHDRVEAYLNILQQQTSSNRHEAKPKPTIEASHPCAGQYLALVEDVLALMQTDNDRHQLLRCKPALLI